MRELLVVGNWKMNGSATTIARLLDALRKGLETGDAKAGIGVCAPYVYIPQVAEALRGTAVLYGAQNVADHEAGAYTGEVSALMLQEFGCRLALVGHSERRLYYRESNALVGARLRQALQHGLQAILCVGETLEQREEDATYEVIAGQLDDAMQALEGDAMRQATIAYEPVWAIGTGRTATPEQAQEVHAFIRNRLAEHDASVADHIRILYGGSVKADNAADLFAMPDIDGALVGGASLDAESFLSIYKSANMVA